MPKATHVECSLTPAEAKRKVFEHWEHLDALCKRRFPNDENLAHAALLFVLQKLEANEWRRVCAWRLGHFLPFVTTLTSRLLTDFARQRFGHIRLPTWLVEKEDPVWSSAYRLLVVEKLDRHETIERLLQSEPHRGRWYIDDVVVTIRNKCQKKSKTGEKTVSLREAPEPPAVGSTPDEVLQITEQELIEALQSYLQTEHDAAPRITPRVSELLARLNALLRLSEEDRLLLRLRYVNGLRMKSIVNLVHLKGDPYKRYDKLIKRLREACQRIGLVPG